MRYLIDTHIFIWYAKERDRLSRDVLAMLEDYDNQICLSSESLREFVLLWNNKPHIRRWWKTPMDMIRDVEEHYFQILYLHKEHYERYARLEINEAQEHYDPSDHLIISHALCRSTSGRFALQRTASRSSATTTSSPFTAPRAWN